MLSTLTRPGRWLPAGLAAALVVALLAGCANGGQPAGTSGPPTAPVAAAGSADAPPAAPPAAPPPPSAGTPSPRDPDGETAPAEGLSSAAAAAPSPNDFLLVADVFGLPEQVRQWYENGRETEGASQFDAGDERYLLVSAGARPTGGYSLELREIRAEDEGWRLEAELRRPAPGAMVTQVVTYPSLLFSVPPGPVKVWLQDGAERRSLPVASDPGPA